MKIRHRDAHLVVVEKPAGVTATRHSEESRLAPPPQTVEPHLGRDGPADPCPAAAGPSRRAGKSTRYGLRVRAVHRLDRDTSGLMVLALSAEAERRLVQMFRQHKIQRVYQAVVAGHVEAQTFSSYLVRDRGDGRRGSTTLPGVGKPAVTHVRPLEHLQGYTLLECRLETGRTHQIRIHLAEAGHPVCGEKVYHSRFLAAGHGCQRCPAAGVARRGVGLRASHHRPAAFLLHAAARRHVAADHPPARG